MIYQLNLPCGTTKDIEYSVGELPRLGDDIFNDGKHFLVWKVSFPIEGNRQQKVVVHAK
jgi:hypothetical protein